MSNVFSIGLLLLCIRSFTTQGNPPQGKVTYDQAWQYEQTKRNDLRGILYDPNTAPTEMQNALRELENLRTWCLRPEIKILKDSWGTASIHLQQHDILIDLMEGYANLGDKTKVVYWLEELRKTLPIYYKGDSVGMYSFFAQRIVDSNHIKKVRPNAQIDQIVSEFLQKDPLRVLRGVPFATADSDNISQSDRIAGLSLIWSEAKYNFANFDLVSGLDWDNAYNRFLAKITPDQTRYEYYNHLREFIALLKDSHTDINLPLSLRTKYEAYVPLGTTLVQNKVVVTSKPFPELEALGVRKGDVIEKIDNRDAVEYGHTTWASRLSCSTPQDADVRTFSYMLLCGPQDKPVTLELGGLSGPRKVEIPRNLKVTGRPRILDGFKLLPDGTAYFAFNTCESDEVSKAFIRHLPEIKKSGRLIIDCRNNGGGDSNVGYDILRCLIRNKVKATKGDTRVYRTTYRTTRETSGSLESNVNEIKPFAKPFLGPVAVLLGPRTFSAAEDFLVAYKMSKRGLMIGMPSGGSTGQPIVFPLPGGGSFRICSKRDRMASGEEFVGIGVQPDIKVKNTIEAVRTDRDLVLERAISEVRGARN